MENMENMENTENILNAENLEIRIIPETYYSPSVFCYIPQVITLKEESDIFEWLKGISDFQSNPNSNNTKYSRLQKWFQQDGKYFCPKWKYRPYMWKSYKYDSKLLEIQNKTQQITKDIILHLRDTFNVYVKTPTINSCLINKYRDGNDYIKPHRDTDLSFGPEPTIIGLSLGQSREICFKRRIFNPCDKPLSKLDRGKQDLNFKFNLESGSMFIMAGSSQRFFSHEIPKSDRNCDSRYSLTFREFIG